MPDITLRQIRYFQVLSATLQYRRAARQLGISQPSLSLQIAALEEAVGAKLLERRRNGLILTPVGRDAAAQAEKVLREVEALEYIAGPSHAALSGTLRLGASPTIGPYLLPRVLRQLHLAHPDLKLVIRDGPPRELSEDLLAGRYDMILTQLPLAGEEVRVQPLFREPLTLAVPNDHRLVGRHKVRPEDLAGESVLSLSPAYALHGQVAGLCATAGATLRDEFEGTSLDALRQMVSLGMGVTLLPALYAGSEVRMAGAEEADVAVLQMQPKMHRQIGLAWRRASGNPPAFVQFGTLIREVVANAFAEKVNLQG
ncbi:MAG: LysR family transcriptional regulator [Rhodobacteraceae bacterium]|nr:LysR family transcriptional regulator [Paracoccaceae bacterium]